MPRRPRTGTGGLVFHVMNRGSRRLRLFDDAADYVAFARVLREATERVPMRVLCYALMPNHWHLVLWPLGDRDLAEFMAWMTATHVRRWHRARGSVGSGTLYQGRYKAIAVKDDDHFLTVCRYVERNPVRAGLVSRAEDWPWSTASGTVWRTGPPLHAWPVARPDDWSARLAEAEAAHALEAVRRAIRTSRPWGPDEWTRLTCARLGWRTGMRGAGRPPRSREDRRN
jgi:putative transposase